MLHRLLSFLILAQLLGPLPVAAQIDDTDYSSPELTQADAIAVRNELSRMREKLNAGTSALENGDWSSAQYDCYVAKETATNSPYRAQDAYYDARVIGRTCMADAAYMRGNQTSACEWWEQVDYDSLIGLDPWEICSRVTSPEPASSVTNARPEPDEAAPRNMTTTFAEVASLSPPSALANHGFPRFGMTPAEVVAASSGAMSRVAGRVGSEVFNLSMLAEGSLNTGEKMMFYFAKSDESLALVKVIPPPVHAAHLTLDCPESGAIHWRRKTRNGRPASGWA